MVFDLTISVKKPVSKEIDFSRNVILINQNVPYFRCKDLENLVKVVHPNPSKLHLNSSESNPVVRFKK